MEYRYIVVDSKRVDHVLSTFAANGWRVHTFNRNPNASVVDILFEKQVPLP